MGKKTHTPNRIREIRKAKGITQVELGDAMASELTDSTIAKLESGAMVLTVPYLLEIAAALGVEPLELLFESERTGVRYVPVVNAQLLIQASDWREAVISMGQMQAIPSHIEGDNLFCIRAMSDNVSADMLRHMPSNAYLIVDADSKELVDGRTYLLNVGERACVKLFDAAQMAFLPTPSNAGGAPFPIGSEPFQVEGRVVHIGYDL